MRSCVNYKRLIKNFRLWDIVRYVKILVRALPSIKTAIKSVLWFLQVKNIDELIKDNNYDIIHIHGVGFSCYISSLAAAYNRKPFLFTMHGLISYGISGIARIDSNAEQAVLSIIRHNNFLATAVSSGTRRVPCEDKGIDLNKIRVINNAIKTTNVTDTDYWYDLFPQARGKKIIIGIGTIGSNKNQLLLLRAFLMLPKQVQENTVVMLAGKDIKNGAIERFIFENHLQDNVFICGFVEKKQLSNLYAIADYNDVVYQIILRQDRLEKKSTHADSLKQRSITLVVNDKDTIKAILDANFQLGIVNKMPYEDKVTVKHYGFFESFPAGIEHGWNVMKSYVDQLKYLFTKKGAKSVGGFIGIGKIFSPVWDWAKFWDMTAFLSVALGVMNLLPIPALDGGHAIITVFEMCTGKKPSDKFLEKIQIVGMWLLLGLMLWANLNDILKLIGLY